MSAPSISRILPPVEASPAGRRAIGRDGDDAGRTFALPPDEREIRQRPRDPEKGAIRQTDKTDRTSDGDARASAARKQPVQQGRETDPAEAGKDEAALAAGRTDIEPGAGAAVAGKGDSETETGSAANAAAGTEVKIDPAAASVPVTTPFIIAQAVAPTTGIGGGSDGTAAFETAPAAIAGLAGAARAAGSTAGDAGKAGVGSSLQDVLVANTAQAATEAATDAPAKVVDAAGASATDALPKASTGEPAATALAVAAQAGVVQAAGEKRVLDGIAQQPAPEAAGEGKAGETVSSTGVAVPVVAAATKRPNVAAPAIAPARDGANESGEAATLAQAQGEGAPVEKSGAVAEAPAALSSGAKAEVPAPEAGQAAAQQQPGDVPALPMGTPRPVAAPQLDAALFASQPQDPGQAETSRPTPIHVVPVEIGMRALAGNRQFDIRLDPGELGRVDVRLDISEDGDVTAKLTVDRVETLHLLQRDARTLERAFEQAGLKTSEGGVQISLRDPSDQPGSRQGGQQDDAPARNRRLWAASGDDTSTTTSLETLSARRVARVGGVDLSI